VNAGRAGGGGSAPAAGQQSASWEQQEERRQFEGGDPAPAAYSVAGHPRGPVHQQPMPLQQPATFATQHAAYFSQPAAGKAALSDRFAAPTSSHIASHGEETFRRDSGRCPPGALHCNRYHQSLLPADQPEGGERGEQYPGQQDQQWHDNERPLPKVHGGIGDGGCDFSAGWPGDSSESLQGQMQPAGVHPTPNHSAAIVMMAAAAAAAAAAVAGGFSPEQAAQRAHGAWPPTAQFPPSPLPQQQQQQQHPRPHPPLPPGYTGLASQRSQQHLVSGGGHASWTRQPR